jgi:hypothetical protein
MLLAGESTQISKEDQDGWPGRMVMVVFSLPLM